jgi:hypothetical protein
VNFSVSAVEILDGREAFPVGILEVDDVDALAEVVYSHQVSRHLGEPVSSLAMPKCANRAYIPKSSPEHRGQAWLADRSAVTKSFRTSAAEKDAAEG